ncbi:muramoyltetrapeptide carboxypeptidase [Roseivivax lentus]|uniref:Muramoyltetrapeptide carboxypeptidase n=1 Tax=Roseivivax lentus TaxID=633194 RepID=A0A1N7Q7A1_9RHOB|nr:LD-carboxypeptidase [Roseivivax lentus]SIT18457.1 muramoyltetrapeptide carboxypeptidase [Roseivivax lentus]
MRPLAPGDTIGIVSPASAAQGTVYEDFSRIAESRGYSVKVFGETEPTFGRMTGSDRNRANSLIAAFEDDEVTAVICARGGYGSGRLLSHLDPSRVKNKIFVGYSDITNLLVHLNTMCRITTFHGPMAADLAGKNDPDTMRWLFSFLEGKRLAYDLSTKDHRVFRSGEASGMVFGGNISTLETLIGTESWSMPEGAILFLEDTNEFMYSLDRSLVHLQRSGVFEKASAIIFADLQLKDASDRDNSIGFLLEELLEIHFGDFSGPIIFDAPCGHTQRQMTIPLGVQARLEAAHDGSRLEFENFWNCHVPSILAA